MLQKVPSTVQFPYPEAPAPGTALPIADGVLWIRMPLPMALDHVNVFAFDAGDSWHLVDAGMGGPTALPLWEALLQGPLGGKPVSKLLLTHHHMDHIGMAGWLHAKGAQILTSRVAWLSARVLNLDVQEEVTPEQLAFWRAAGMPAEIYDRRSKERPFNAADTVGKLPIGFTRLHEGQFLDFGNRQWRVRLGDGHAPEHVTLWQEGGSLVVGGDQLLPSISPNLGVYPSEPEADPVGDWIASCQRFRPHAREDHLVLPGHKLPFTGLPHRLDLMMENHHHALKRLLDHLATPKTACECFVPLFHREITGGAHGLALVEAVGHLNHLWRQGLVSRTTTAEGVWLWQRIQD